jgi:hypothetical protein
MHVVVTVNAVWLRTIKPPELVKLRCYQVLEGACESGMIYNLG